METKFNYEDTKFYADKLRGHCNTSGPWWSTLLRFVPMFDEVTRLQSALTTAQEENKRYKDALETAYEALSILPSGNVIFDRLTIQDAYNKVKSALNGGK